MPTEREHIEAEIQKLIADGPGQGGAGQIVVPMWKTALLQMHSTRLMTAAIDEFKVSSDAAAKRIEDLTTQLVRLTIALFVLTLVLGLLAAPPAIETIRDWFR